MELEQCSFLTTPPYAGVGLSEGSGEFSASAPAMGPTNDPFTLTYQGNGPTSDQFLDMLVLLAGQEARTVTTNGLEKPELPLQEPTPPAAPSTVTVDDPFSFFPVDFSIEDQTIAHTMVPVDTPACEPAGFELFSPTVLGVMPAADTANNATRILSRRRSRASSIVERHARWSVSPVS
ncbi:hypothetical protein K488DRAFT_83777 [Vararia minispora EC-137]|uniref:Uncharacterized protein n=1 Tax=Vararia minispora EC-137 TaxID=1314806 RepID=A0ACB8QS91_9AGAM|nr:hypothetical protein K488DRAFT_83777 [Vararia minispora EC-137]